MFSKVARWCSFENRPQVDLKKRNSTPRGGEKNGALWHVCHTCFRTESLALRSPVLQPTFQAAKVSPTKRFHIRDSCSQPAEMTADISSKLILRAEATQSVGTKPTVLHRRFPRNRQVRTFDSTPSFRIRLRLLQSKQISRLAPDHLSPIIVVFDLDLGYSTSILGSPAEYNLRNWLPENESSLALLHKLSLVGSVY